MSKDEKMPLVIVQSLLGNSSIKTTLVYAKADIDLLSNEVQRLGDRLIDGPSTHPAIDKPKDGVVCEPQAA